MKALKAAFFRTNWKRNKEIEEVVENKLKLMQAQRTQFCKYFIKGKM